MSYVLHTDVYKAEDALGWFKGQRCKHCGEPIPEAFNGWDSRTVCDACDTEGIHRKTCPVCGETFRTDAKTQVCCSHTCARRRVNDRRRRCV